MLYCPCSPASPTVSCVQVLFDRQGLLKIRGEVKKSDAVATLLATKAIQNQLVEAWSHC